MTILTRWGPVLLAAVGIPMALGGCGQGDQTGAAVVQARTEIMTCENGVEPIAELLRAGMPTYDYQPVADLAELVDLTDMITHGVLLSAQRAHVDLGDGAGSSSFTEIQPADGQVIWPDDGQSTAEPFRFMSQWADRSQPDPLAEGVTFDRTRPGYIAFLIEGSDGSPRTPHIQGLAISCGPDEPAVTIGDSIPGTEGMSIDEMAAAVLELIRP